MSIKTLCKLAFQIPTVKSIRSIVTTTSTVLNGKKTLDANPENSDYEEIRISVPWGHLAGKWWGPKNERPVLCLHGWQDNAGTFDRLAPFLPKHIGFLAVDLPGHGFSSRFSDGPIFSPADNVYFIRLIMKAYGWQKVSFLNHSMSSITGFLFCASYPDKVDMMIGLDALKPPITEIETYVKYFGWRIDNLILADERNRENTEPPSYSYEELIDKLHNGTDKSIDRESCPYLLRRNIRESAQNPNKYFFTRDGRLRIFGFWGIPQAACLLLAEKITAPYLFIKSSRSIYIERTEYYEEVLNVMMNKPNFEYYLVDGTHHVLLNEPEKISEIVNPFINKHRPQFEIEH